MPPFMGDADGCRSHMKIHSSSSDSGEPAEIFDRVTAMLRDYVASAEDRGQKVIEFKDPQEIDQIMRQCGCDLSLHDGKRVGAEAIVSACAATLRLSARTGHPQFFNTLFGRSDASGLVGEMLTVACNTSAYTFEIAPVFVMVEASVIDKTVQLLGFDPTTSEGLFVPGGSIANLYGLQLARFFKFPEVKRKGIQALPGQLVCYCSAAAHYSYAKAAHLMGIGEDNMKEIPIDDRGRMKPEELERQIRVDLAAGSQPFFVGATAGTTVWGSFDELVGLRAVCDKYGLWLHVDGAWGGAALLGSPATRDRLLRGVEKVDSFCWNPHKMVGAPLQCSMVVHRKGRGLLHACNGTQAPYLFQKEKLHGDMDRGDWTIQCGRRPDAFKIWLAWKHIGDEALRHRVEWAIELSQYAAKVITQSDKSSQFSGRFELHHDPEYANVCFWYIPPSLNHLKPSSGALSPDEASMLCQLCVQQVIPYCKDRMQNLGLAMITFTGEYNFFRWTFANPRSVTRDDVVDVLKDIDLGIATDVGKDFEGLQMVFARRAAARQCEDPKPSFIATLVEELGSLSAGSRLAVAKYLHVLVVTDASSAACFGRAPNGLRLLVQILSNDQVFHKYLPLAVFCLADDDQSRCYMLDHTMTALARLIDPQQEQEVLGHACLALSSLSLHEDSATALVVEWGKIADLWRHLIAAATTEDGMSPLVSLGAAVCLLLQHTATQTMLVDEGALDLILEALTTSRGEATPAKAAVWISAALSHLASSPVNLKGMSDASVSTTLHRLAISDVADVRLNAAWTLAFLASNQGATEYNSSVLSWIRDLLLLTSVSGDDDALQQEVNSLVNIAFGQLSGAEAAEISHLGEASLHHELSLSRCCEARKEAIHSFAELLRAGDVAQDLVATYPDDSSTLLTQIRTLAQLCRSSDTRVCLEAMNLMAFLYLQADFSEPLVAEGGVGRLVSLCWSLDDDDVQLACAKSLLRFITAEQPISYAPQQLQHSLIRSLLILADSRSVAIRRTAIMGLWVATRRMASGSPSVLTPTMRAGLVDTPPASLEAALIESARDDNLHVKATPMSPQMAAVGCLVALTYDAEPETHNRILQDLLPLAARRDLSRPAWLCMLRTLSALRRSEVEGVQEGIFDAYGELCRTLTAEGETAGPEDRIELLLDCAKDWLACIGDLDQPVATRRRAFALLRSLLAQQQPAVSDSVCALIGAPKMMEVILKCGSPGHAFLVAVASPPCPHALELVCSNAPVLEEIMDAVASEMLHGAELAESDIADSLVFPLFSALDRARSWPIVLAILRPRRRMLFELLPAISDSHRDSVAGLLRVITAVLGHSRQGMDRGDYEHLAGSMVGMLSPPTTAEILHEAVGLVQELARVEASRSVIHVKGILSPSVVEAALTAADQRTLPRLFASLQLGCTSPETMENLASSTLIEKSLALLTSPTTDQQTTLRITGFLLELARDHRAASTLREEMHARTVFSLLRRENASASRCAIIELIYALARPDPSFRRLLVDLDGDAPSALASLVQLATGGPLSVRSHAAWLVSSLAACHGAGVEYTFKLVAALSRLLTSEEATVLEHALWGLTQVSLDDDEVVERLVAVGVPAIVCNLRSGRHSVGVRCGRMRVVAHLATNMRLKAGMVANTDILRIAVEMLASEDPSLKAAAAASVASLARGVPNVGRELCRLGVASMLLSMLQLPDGRIAIEAIAELALVPEMVEEVMQSNAVAGLLSSAEKHLEDCKMRLSALSTESPSKVGSRAGARLASSTSVCIEDETDFEFPLVAVYLVNRIAQVNRASREAVINSGGASVIVKAARCAPSDSQTMLEVISSIGILGRDGGSELAEKGAIEILHTALHAVPGHAAVREKAERALEALSDELRE
ncbi:Glutamate decarboxylase 2 [Perkinsus olseni]|uniref:Glutamate decarboxylase 2 n=1 Tax=Perkinsus olseni TaxID=32597 RepID=A0A7J6MEX4_PEROL|nr:Glutamate decarboxylase 2 [Perkinsus olseni]